MSAWQLESGRTSAASAGVGCFGLDSFGVGRVAFFGGSAASSFSPFFFPMCVREGSSDDSSSTFRTGVSFSGLTPIVSCIAYELPSWTWESVADKLNDGLVEHVLRTSPFLFFPLVVEGFGASSVVVKLSHSWSVPASRANLHTHLNVRCGSPFRFCKHDCPERILIAEKCKRSHAKG